MNSPANKPKERLMTIIVWFKFFKGALLIAVALGARHFRIEFVNEDGEETARTIAKYQALLKGEITGGQLWRELKLHNRLGVTRGPMEA